MGARHETIRFRRSVVAVPDGTTLSDAEDFYRIQETGATRTTLIDLLEGQKTVVLSDGPTSFTGTVQLQGSIGDDVWIDIGSAQSSFPTALSFDLPFLLVRIDVTAYTSGELLARIAGFNQRVES